MGDFFMLTLASGTLCAILSNPLFLVNTRIALSTDGKSMVATIVDIARNEGPLTFYKGLVPNLIMVINPIINYVIYESLKQHLGAEQHLSVLATFLISSFSKSCATFVTYPILTIRVRLHASVALRNVTPDNNMLKHKTIDNRPVRQRCFDYLSHTYVILSTTSVRSLYAGFAAKFI
jgi:Mitochondrial carrier protein